MVKDNDSALPLDGLWALVWVVSFKRAIWPRITRSSSALLTSAHCILDISYCSQDSQIKKFETYHFFASSLVSLQSSLHNLKAFSTDGEKAISNAMQIVLDTAILLRCFLLSLSPGSRHVLNVARREGREPSKIYHVHVT